jgi:putative effector of murein hydrolase LrgA (UPF0299 family)
MTGLRLFATRELLLYPAFVGIMDYMDLPVGKQAEVL